MEERGQIKPGLPVPNPTISYWQDPPSDIATLCSTPTLPPTADYIIIGSGISGVSIAHNLLTHKPHASILMLEARVACSGATGRNGGHTKAASYRSFLEHEELYGTAEAVKIARLEYAVIRATHRMARDLQIDCASNPCDTVDIIYSRSHLVQAQKAIKRMREAMGHEDPAARYEIVNAEDASTRFLAPGALGAVVYEAGSLSAYRFTIGVLKTCIARGLNLQTGTPALSLSPAKDSNADAPLWSVATLKGCITARKVIVATNGYAAHLLPQLQGLVVPLRGQITAQRPGTRLARTSLDHTYSYIYETGYEYMIPRPSFTPDAGTIVIGGGLGTLPAGGVTEFGNTDDEQLNSDLSAYLRDCTARYFGENWGDDDEQGRIKREWSGIMGTSADGLPYVGAVPNMQGVWASVSFNGHGMVLCLKCAEACVEMLTADSEEDQDSWRKVEDWFPKCMLLDGKRFGEVFQGRLNMKPPGEAMFE